MMRMQDVIRDCKSRNNHFFDADTMEFWNSKVCSELLDNNCFVTSEDNFDRTRILYSVRQYAPEDSDCIKTIGFQKWSTLESALEFAKEI